MNDLATLTGQPVRSLKVDGQAYDLHPLTLDDYGRLQAWVDRQFPDPFDVVSAQIERGRLVVDADGNESRVPYPMAQQQYMLRSGARTVEPGPAADRHAEADAKVQATEGVQEMMFLSITKGRPAFTPTQGRCSRIDGRPGRGDLLRHERGHGARRPKSTGDAWECQGDPELDAVGEPVNWWTLWHKAMRELPWAAPDRLGRMTIPQLMCLGREHPPGRDRLRTLDAFRRRTAEILQAQESWQRDGQ